MSDDFIGVSVTLKSCLKSSRRLQYILLLTQNYYSPPSVSAGETITPTKFFGFRTMTEEEMIPYIFDRTTIFLSAVT
jgi:hypothetical protein